MCRPGRGPQKLGKGGQFFESSERPVSAPLKLHVETVSQSGKPVQLYDLISSRLLFRLLLLVVVVVAVVNRKRKLFLRHMIIGAAVVAMVTTMMVDRMLTMMWVRFIVRAQRALRALRVLATPVTVYRTLQKHVHVAYSRLYTVS